MQDVMQDVTVMNAARKSRTFDLQRALARCKTTEQATTALLQFIAQHI